MANKNSSSGGGIGFVGLLTIVFITLKLLGKITWSWLWVLSPIWISAALVVAFCAIVLIGMIGGSLLAEALDARSDRVAARKRARLGARRTSGRIIDAERKRDDSFVN